MKARVTLSIDVNVYREFKARCARKGLKVSEEVERLMKEALDEGL